MSANVAAIVLAAGSSRRFGEANKLLALIEAKPLLLRAIEAIEAAGIERVTIVTGHEAERIAAVTTASNRRHVYNSRHSEGMGTSIAVGVASIEDDIDGVLIAQGDMPAIDAELVAMLLRHFIDAGCNQVVYPLLAEGRQGNPVIWPRRLFGSLANLTGDKGGKMLIEVEGDRAIRIAIDGCGPRADIDTPEELAAYLSERSSEPS